MKKLPKLNIKRKLLTGLLLSVVLSVVGIATAQELQRTITVAYPSLAHTLNPGGRAEGITKIINESNVPLTFTLNVQDFVVNDTLGTPNILPPGTLNKKYSAAAWIGITPNTFTLKPGEKQTINYYIQIPKDARPGGHYAAIVYTPRVEKGVEGTGGTVNAQLGSIFYITVNGQITEKSTVTKFFANAFQEYGPVKILTQIKNFGDLHIRPNGTINVTGLFYNKTQDLPLHNIFPETARDFENTFGSTFMFGRYKAVFLASYGVNNNLPLTATLYFWVFPWRLAIIIVLIIVAVMLGLMYWKKRKDHKEHEQPEEEVVEEETKNTESSKKVG